MPREEWLWGFNHYSLLRILLVKFFSTPQKPTISPTTRTARSRAPVQVETISRALGEHLGLGAHAQLAFGYAHLAAGRAADAAESARTALDLLRRVDKAYAGKAASFLADALLQAGDLSAAQSRRRGGDCALPPLAARYLRSRRPRRPGACAASPRRSGGPRRCRSPLASVAALIERCGARTLAPALCEWRAELAAVLGDDVTRERLLRQAQQGYDEIGAPGHVARLRQELGS
jgi:hypothetical protein